MYAIVLSYDDRVSYVELVLKSYLFHLNKIPFTFRIPYNKKKINICDKLDIEYIKTNKSIISTINNLLQGLDDEEFIYWCVDDRYVINFLDNNDVIVDIANYLQENKVSYDAIRLYNKVGVEKINLIKVCNRDFVIDYRRDIEHGFWHHHFVKVKVIKHYLLNHELGNRATITEIHRNFMEKNTIYYNILLPYENILNFGETTLKNVMLKNCMADMKKYNINYKNVKEEYLTRHISRIYT